MSRRTSSITEDTNTTSKNGNNNHKTTSIETLSGPANTPYRTVLGTARAEQFLLQTAEQRQRMGSIQRARLLRYMALLIGGLVLATALVTLLLPSPQVPAPPVDNAADPNAPGAGRTIRFARQAVNLQVLFLAPGAWCLLFCLASYFLLSFYLRSLKRETAQARPHHFQVGLASYLLILGVVGMVVLLELERASDTLVITLLVLVPLLAGITGLDTRATWVLDGLGLILLITLYILDRATTAVFLPFGGNVPNGTTTDNTFANTNANFIFGGRFAWDGFLALILTYLLVAGGVILFMRRQHQFRQELAIQTSALADLLQTLKSSNQLGSSLSQSLSGVVSELSATSHQQAATSQQQLAALNEATTSLEELSETANQIASSVALVADAAEQTLLVSADVQQAGQLVQNTADQGREAVLSAISSVAEVRNRIELLGQRLLNLTEQARKVNTIADLINEIADETHLLALNASIEAAGSSLGGTEMGGLQTVRAERFSVIAQEIKNLADRSREATEEVQQAVSEMQGATAAAVLVAEEGKKETAAAMTRAQIAGMVIDQLNEVLNTSLTRLGEIVGAAEIVSDRCDEIRVATGQQRTASAQIVQTMRSLNEVSQQNSSGILNLSETAGQLTEQVVTLNQVLGVASTRVALA